MTPGLFIKGSMVGSTIKDNVDGYLSELDTVKYKNRIIEIINDKKLLNKVSRNAKKNLGDSWKNVAKKYYDIYLEEVNNKLI